MSMPRGSRRAPGALEGSVAPRHAGAPAGAARSPMSKAVRLLEAGDWQAAHTIVQSESSTLGCWAHGIVHLLEGDLDNARYWYRRAHRALPHLDTVNAEIAALKDAIAGGRAR